MIWINDLRGPGPGCSNTQFQQISLACRAAFGYGLQGFQGLLLIADLFQMFYFAYLRFPRLGVINREHVHLLFIGQAMAVHS